MTPTQPSDPEPPFADARIAGALSAARQGDRDALADLLAECLPDLTRWLERRVGGVLRDRESISDLAQSVCREVLCDLDRFEHRGEQAFRKWLIQQAGRKVINRYRYHQREARAPGREAPGLEPEGLVSADPSPSQVVAGQDELGLVQRAIEALPEGQREAVTLHRLMGWDYPEVARRMGRTEAAARSLVARGLAELAQRLAVRPSP